MPAHQERSSRRNGGERGNDRTDVSGRLSKPALHILAGLWRFARRHRKLILVGAVLGPGDALAQLSIPLFLKYVINGLQVDAAAFWQNQMPYAVGAGILIALAFFPMAYFYHVLVGKAVVRTQRDMRRALYNHVQRQSADFFIQTNVGEVASRINGDIDAGIQCLNYLQVMGWHAVMFVIALGMMIWISPRLSLLFFVFAVLVWLLSSYYVPRIRKKSREVRDKAGEISAAVVEYISALDLIRAFSREGYAGYNVSRTCEEHTEKAEALLGFQFTFSDIMQVIARFVAPFSLLFAGGWLIMKGHMLIGDLIAFAGYWGSVVGGISVFSHLMGIVFSGLASLDRVFEYFEASPMVQDAPDAVPLQHVRGEVALEDVTFNYPVESNVTVLDNVSLTVPEGRKIAIVGPSGAGKSTVLHLLLRFYDPRKGRVLIDGKDVRTIQQQSLRDNIGIVMQESVFLSGTVAENLQFAKLHATDEEMWEALRNADAEDFVRDAPDGLHTMLGERGTRLSGGQKQRLAIARVFLKDPSILIFDEATSSLDSVAEVQIQDTMKRLLKGRTAILIAHRIATIQDADEIIVLDEGKIVARGTHEELMQASHLYATLCELQSISAT